MYICPICNGLYDYVKICPSCGAQMQILDRVENYYDSYSGELPYELTDLNDGDPPNICRHITVCPKCGYRTTVGISNVLK